MINKFKKEILVIVVLFLSSFTLAACENRKQIQLLSDKIVELENRNTQLSSEIDELKRNNEKLASEKDEEKSNYQKLIEINTNLQKENSDLKKKLEAAEENKHTQSNKGTDKIAYLTFDDGPSDNTPKILDILKENGIKATFFVNGRPDRKEIYKRIVNEGHVIGNHTYSHDYSSLYKTIDGFNNDKQKLDDLLFEVTGLKPTILRFPGGSNNHVSFNYGGADFMDKLTHHVKEAGIKYFDWNVDSTDASAVTQNRDKIINEVLKGSKNKKQAIILMHDSPPKTTTVEALPSILKGLKEQGFKFSTLSPEVNTVQFK